MLSRPGTSIKVPDLEMSVKSPGLTWETTKHCYAVVGNNTIKRGENLGTTGAGVV